MGTDSSDNLYQQKLQGLQITHVPTGKIVEFKAFLTAFTDNYASKWNAQDVYGRMDPIATFQNTRRNVNIAWTVPAFGATEAQTNLQRASRFFEMLYPAYASGKNTSGANQISAAPLLRFKFANLACSITESPQILLDGLLGFVNGTVSLRPDLNAGFWDEFEEELYPMAFSLAFDLTVLHTHELGWDATAGTFRGNKGGRSFPYGSPTYFEFLNKINPPPTTNTGNNQIEGQNGKSIPDRNSPNQEKTESPLLTKLKEDNPNWDAEQDWSHQDAKRGYTPSGLIADRSNTPAERLESQNIEASIFSEEGKLKKSFMEDLGQTAKISKEDYAYQQNRRELFREMPAVNLTEDKVSE